MIFKGCRCGNDLERRARFIRHRNDFVFRHTPDALNLGVRVKCRVARHRKDFARVRIHNHGACARRLELGDTVLQGLLHNFLQVAVYRQNEIQSGFRLDNVLRTVIDFSTVNILDTHTNTFVTAEAIVKNFLHAHAAAAVIAHLSHDLRGKRTLQEQTAIAQVVARIAHAFGKHDTVTVQNRATLGIQVFRMRHHGLCIHLIHATVQNLDVKRLQHKHANRAEDKAFQYKQGICAVLIHSTPPLP